MNYTKRLKALRARRGENQETFNMQKEMDTTMDKDDNNESIHISGKVKQGFYKRAAEHGIQPQMTKDMLQQILSGQGAKHLCQGYDPSPGGPFNEIGVSPVNPMQFSQLMRLVGSTSSPFQGTPMPTDINPGLDAFDKLK